MWIEWFVRKLEWVYTEMSGMFVKGRRDVGVNLWGRTRRRCSFAMMGIGALLVDRAKLNPTRNRPQTSLKEVYSRREHLK